MTSKTIAIWIIWWHIITDTAFEVKLKHRETERVREKGGLQQSPGDLLRPFNGAKEDLLRCGFGRDAIGFESRASVS